jgi:hypothetical protein
MISTLWSVVPWPHLLELPRKIQCFGQFCVDGVSMFSSDYCSCGVSFLGVSESLECLALYHPVSGSGSRLSVEVHHLYFEPSCDIWLGQRSRSVWFSFLAAVLADHYSRMLGRCSVLVLCAQRMWLTDDNLSDRFFFLAATIGREDLRCTCQVSLICGCMCTPR